MMERWKQHIITEHQNLLQTGHGILKDAYSDSIGRARDITVSRHDLLLCTLLEEIREEDISQQRMVASRTPLRQQEQSSFASNIIVGSSQWIFNAVLKSRHISLCTVEYAIILRFIASIFNTRLVPAKRAAGRRVDRELTLHVFCRQHGDANKSCHHQ